MAISLNIIPFIPFPKLKMPATNGIFGGNGEIEEKNGSFLLTLSSEIAKVILMFQSYTFIKREMIFLPNT